MPEEQSWLRRLDQIIIHHIPSGSPDNKILAAQMAISERHLIRKVKALTGLSPRKYIGSHRLRLAMAHLEKGTFRTVKETAGAVGYTSVSYFIRQFEAEFGKRPLEVLQEWGWR